MGLIPAVVVLQPLISVLGVAIWAQTVVAAQSNRYSREPFYDACPVGFGRADPEWQAH